MIPEVFKFDPSLISVNRAQILNLLEQSENEADNHIADLVDKLIPGSAAAATPMGGFVWEDQISLDPGNRLKIGREKFAIGPEIFRKLKHAGSVVIFAVTAGPGPETLARELMHQGSYLEGFITDLIGTAIVEWVADQVHQTIREQAAIRGLKVTNRYSPGYCSWDVKEQQKLFRLIPPESCGISLAESSLMTPIKSVSGIIGTGSRVSFSPNSCRYCPMTTCSFRRISR